MVCDSWPDTLVTPDPQSGFELTVRLARLAVRMTQSDPAARKFMRPIYAGDANSLIFASGVVALHYQTIAAANDYWKKQT